MLLGNFNVFNLNGGRAIGLQDPTVWIKGGSIMNFYGGEATTTETYKTCLTNGYLPPYSLGLPVTAGGLSLCYSADGRGNVDSANLAGGINITSAMAGSGAFGQANATMLAFMIASIANSGSMTASISGGLQALCNIYGLTTVTANLGDGITRVGIISNITGSSVFSADIQAIEGKLIGASINGSSTVSPSITGVKWAQSDISGSSSLQGSLGALAGMVMAINAGGALSQALATALAHVSANITQSTDLSPESIATSVWNSIATEFNQTGTFGSKLNLASSGGIDYDTLVNSIWSALQSNYTDPATIGGVLALLQEKTTELHKIQGLDKSNPMTVTKTQRASGDVVMDLSGDGEEITIVTRQ